MHYSEPRIVSAMKERVHKLNQQRNKLSENTPTISNNLMIEEKEILIKHYQDKLEKKDGQENTQTSE